MSKELFFVFKEDQNSMKSKIKERNPDFILLKNEDLLLKNQIAQINGINMPKKIINSDNSNLPTKQTFEENNIIFNTPINKFLIKDEVKENEEEKKEEKEDENEEEKEEEVKEIMIEEEEGKKKKCGRKRTRDGEEGMHDKYADDNLRRKVKHIVLKELLEFINKKIYEKYNGNIGKGLAMKKLHIINQKQKANSDIIYNKNFLHKKLGDIFSADISSRFTSFLKCHNKIVIENLLNEENVKIRQYFTNLFNLTFLDSLNHFIGKKIFEELLGLPNYKEIIPQYEPNPQSDYKTCLEFYLFYYELIINSKKARKPRKEKNNDNE